MSEEVIPSERELYNDIVEMLSNGNFLQLNGKAINLTELNEYINAQGREIERLTELCNKYEEEHNTTFETWQKDIKENKKLHSIIKEVREEMENAKHISVSDEYHIIEHEKKLLEILDKENN